MKTNQHFKASNILGIQNKQSNFLKTLYLAFTLFFFFAAIPEVQASHFRGGSISWTQVNGNTVRFTVTSSWSSPSIPFLNFGDGTSASVPHSLVASGPGFVTYQGTIDHTYATAGPYTAFWSSCCRIGALQNASNANWIVETVVCLTGGNTGSPVSSVPAIVQMVASGQSFQLPAADPDGDPLIWSWATTTQTGIPTNPPAGFTISPTGLLTLAGGVWSNGQQLALVTNITEGSPGCGAKTVADFIVQIQAASSNVPPTCALNGNAANNINVGVPFSISLTGTDPEGLNLTANPSQLPPGATFGPLSGGSPLTTTFNYTPAQAQANQSFAITLTYVDAGGLTALCSFSVTVGSGCPSSLQLSGTPSAPNCPGGSDGSINLSAGAGTAPFSYMWSNNATTQNISGLTAGVYSVTVTDANNCTDNANFNVPIGVDNTPPIITCPPSVTVNNDEGECSAVLSIDAPTVSDNCSVLSLGNSLNFDGINDIAFIAASSVINTQNQTRRTAEVYFRVDDKNSNSKQVVWEEGGGVNGLNIYVYNGKLYMGVYSGTQGWNPIGSWISTNAIQSGQWHNAVLVFDGNLPQNQRLKGYLDGNLVGTIGTAGPVLNLHPGANAVGGLYNHGVFHDGVVSDTFGHFFGGDIDEIRLWTVARTVAELQATNTVQLAGNEPGLVLYYTMDQGTACADNTGINFLDDMTATGLNGTLQGFNLDGSSGCSSNWTSGAPVLNSEITLTNSFTGTASASGTYPVGETTIIWTATDAVGNTNTCEQIVTVTDNEDPIISCRPDVTRNTDPGLCSAVVPSPLKLSGWGDNCPIDRDTQISYEATGATTFSGTGYNADGNTFNVGTTVLTYTIVDTAGNTNSCSMNVTIIDNEAPTIACRPDVTRNTDPGLCSAVVPSPLKLSGWGDNCPIDRDTQISYEATGATTFSGTGYNADGNTFNVGTTVLTYTIVDTAGNTNSCSMNVTIIDDEDPVINCPVNVTVECPDDTTSASTGLATATDNCDGNPTITQSDEITEGSCAGNYVITRTWTATDSDNNASSCVQTITVRDITNPTWDAEPSDMLTVECDPATNSDAFTTWLASFSGSDSCGTATVTNNSTGIKDACGATGSETVTFTLTDECNNFITKEATFTILDTTSPELECPADISTCADQDLVTGAVVSWTVPVPTDICSTVTLVSDHQPGDTFPVGDTTVTYTATDECNNSTQCTFVITVWELPEIEITESELPLYCQENAKILTANVVSNTGGITYDWSTTETTDNIHVTESGIYSVIVTDANGCTRETSYDVEVIYGDLISAYTILATEEVHLHGDNQVLNGGVGVFDDGEAKIHENTQITGATTFLQATDTDISGTSAVTNTVLTEPNVLLTAFEANPFDSNNDIEVDDNLTLQLDQQVYGKIKVEEGATVIFTQKDVFIKELEVKKNATVQFAGCAFVRVEKGMHFDEYAMINPDNFQVNFYTGDNVQVKKGSVVNASIYALDHEIQAEGKVEAPTFMNGRFIAKKVKGNDVVTWDWNTVCDSDCTPGEVPINITCECDGGIKELTFSYTGNGADLTTNSGMITDNGDGTYTITNAGEKLEKDLEIGNGVVTAEIHTSCSDDILGVTFAGEMTVVAYTDMSQNTSTIETCPFLVDQDCECQGGIMELTFSYEGDGTLLTTNSGIIADNGDGTYTITNGGVKIEKDLLISNGDAIAEIHTSCSQDILGIMFPGGITVINYVDTEGNISDIAGCTPAPAPPEPCDCNGGINEITFTYDGNGADLTTNSGSITDNGDGTYTVSNAGVKLEKDLEISDGVNIAAIHTSCSQDILGVTFPGGITVINYVDTEGNISDIAGCTPAPAPPEPCDCNGGINEITFTYDGNGADLTTNSGSITDNGDGTYTVSNAGVKLEKDLEISDGVNIAAIHTSCSQDILGVTFPGGITVINYVDTEGNISDVVDGCTPAVVPEVCDCNGGINEITFTYDGNGADLTTNSGSITDNGDGTYTVSNAGVKLEKDLEISDGVNIAEIHTSCSQDILGVTFAGGITVIAHVDTEGNICEVDSGGVKRVAEDATAESTEAEDTIEAEDDIMASEFKVKAWPVPSDDSFNIKVSTPNGDTDVRINVYDMNNRLVFTDTFKWDQPYKFGAQLQSGIYFARIIQGNNLETIRVVKY